MKASELVGLLVSSIAEDGDLDVMLPGMDGCEWDDIGQLVTKPLVKSGHQIVCSYEDQKESGDHFHALCLYG